MDTWKNKLTHLPKKPGVYKFLDKQGEVIYIGKAKNLRARVRQYFRQHDDRPQIPSLMKEAADLDYTLMNTELESLYLERMLIQKYHPKYNIDLRDDKNYAFITIDYSFPIPKIGYLRKRNANNKHIVYFGPYTAAYKIRETLNTVRKIFTFCANEKPGIKPCFYYHLHRCPGVCLGQMSLDDYQLHLDKIKLFLSGKITPTIKILKSDMEKAARTKKFEKAARLRDQLRTIEMLEARQNVIMAKPVDWDVLGLAFDESVACVNLFKIRRGRMADKENFVYNTNADPQTGQESVETYNLETLQKFLEQYYSETSDAPKEIMLPKATENAGLIKTLVSDRFNKSVGINIPKKGQASQLIKLSQTNAQEYLKNYLNEKAGHLDKAQRGLAQLKEILELLSIPKRIEGFDISNTQGTNPVGSMVVFIDGLPAKSEYRKFKIQALNTPNDFAMMREMLSRRLQHSMGHEAWEMKRGKWPMPDLIVIDGGKGQLSAALEALQITNAKLQMPDKIQNPNIKIPIIGLAKRIEEIFVPGKKRPIVLPHDNPALQLLQRLRDEAHRFGIIFHRKLRSKQAIKSALDDITGIGPKTKKLLKTKFGTVANIKQAGLNELTEVVGEKTAKMIKQNL